MARNVSNGRCEFCGATFSRQIMTRHLAGCEPVASPSRGKKTKSVAATTNAFHLLVDGGGPYWLQLFARADATLGDLDAYLRGIWLECCGHMSAFTIAGTTYSVGPMDEFADQPMTAKLNKVLTTKMKFQYEYDFGSTTELALTVVADRLIPKTKEKILLAARNEKPVIPCGACKDRPATMVCSCCGYDGGGWLCDDCAKDHECGEEMLLPFVNSPRTGVCGYTG